MSRPKGRQISIRGHDETTENSRWITGRSGDSQRDQGVDDRSSGTNHSPSEILVLPTRYHTRAAQPDLDWLDSSVPRIHQHRLGDDLFHNRSHSLRCSHNPGQPHPTRNYQSPPKLHDLYLEKSERGTSRVWRRRTLNGIRVPQRRHLPTLRHKRHVLHDHSELLHNPIGESATAITKATCTLATTCAPCNIASSIQRPPTKPHPNVLPMFSTAASIRHRYCTPYHCTLATNPSCHAYSIPVQQSYWRSSYCPCNHATNYHHVLLHIA